MKRLAAALTLAAGLAAVHPAQADAGCDGVLMAGTAEAPWTIHIRLDPAGVPLNAPFDAEVIVCSESASRPTRVTVDATMPAHKHGMNYQPSMAKIDAGRYQVENLLFHMPGLWRLEVTAYDNDTPHRFIHEVSVP